MGIPNSFPDKEMLINEMEQQDLELKEAEKLKADAINHEEAMRVKAKVIVQEEDENAARGGLTDEDLLQAEQLIDPEGAEAIVASHISKKGYWSQIKKACMLADIVIQVLDARDPEGSRSDQLHELCLQEGKKIVYIINKTDLVPEDNLKRWLKYYKAKDLMCLPYRGNLFVK